MLDGRAFIGNKVFDKKDLTMQTTIFNAGLYCTGITFVGKFVHGINPICLSVFRVTYMIRFQHSKGDLR